MYCWVLIFALSPFYISIYMYLEIIHGIVSDLSCESNIYVSWCTSEFKAWGWYHETSLSPPVIFLLTIPRWYFFYGSFLFCVCLCYTVLSVSFSLVVTCCENADFLALIYLIFFIFITFPYGILGQVWYLIVSIPDFCHLSYFANTCQRHETLKYLHHP